MSKVIPLHCVTRLDLPVDRVLEMAKERLEGCVILGWDVDGELYFASTYADGGEILWLLEKCKLLLMEVE